MYKGFLNQIFLAGFFLVSFVATISYMTMKINVVMIKGLLIGLGLMVGSLSLDYFDEKSKKKKVNRSKRK